MLTLTKEHYDIIVAHGRAGYPKESCGLIAGKRRDSENEVESKTGGEILVTAVYTLKNIDESAEHFSMDPKDQFKVISEIRKRGDVLLGNFHSHPVTPSRPSEEDIRLAYDPNLIYMILSLKDADPVLKSFVIKDGRYREEEMRVL
jgi:proteasome lid subunit RPN8/RPN11